MVPQAVIPKLAVARRPYYKNVGRCGCNSCRRGRCAKKSRYLHRLTFYGWPQDPSHPGKKDVMHVVSVIRFNIGDLKQCSRVFGVRERTTARLRRSSAVIFSTPPFRGASSMAAIRPVTPMRFCVPASYLRASLHRNSIFSCATKFGLRTLCQP